MIDYYLIAQNKRVEAELGSPELTPNSAQLGVLDHC